MSAALIVSFNASSQPENSVEVLKTVWIYKFLNYIEWPNETSSQQLKISYWGDDDSFYNNLLALNGKQIRTNKIEISRQTGMSPSSDVQVIITGKSKDNLLAKLHNSLSGTSTLVISDNASSKQNIMINFVYPELNSISFELNRYNIIYEKLTLSSDILVIGGTEIDIAEVLNEMNVQLERSQVQLNKREDTLQKLASEISEKEQKIAIQTRDINKRKQQSVLLKQEMDQLLATLEKSYDELTKSYVELAENNQALDEKQQKLSTKEKSIKKLSDAISVNTQTLEQQKKHIEQQEKILLHHEESLVTQEKELTSKTTQIEQQNIVMLSSFTFILLVLCLVYVLQKSSQSKKKSLEVLEHKNIELAHTNEKLINTQSQLVESEKMAALGNLVAGVAHEINTPLGVSVTAVTTSQHVLDRFKDKVENNNLTRSDMNSFLEKLNKATGLMSNNLIRASELVRQFKLVAVDQSSEEIREFLLSEYLNEVLSSLYPQYKKFQCDIEIDCDAELQLNSYPGGIAQIITNLVVNSILHGFDVNKKALIQVEAVEDAENVIITYQDNGQGIDEDNISQIFTPFYTTKRNQGGSGLGLHICYNIASKLGGDIKCIPCDSGAKFVLTVAKSLKDIIVIDI